MIHYMLDQICYEILMSVGGSLDMRKMLAKAMTTYMRRLNCRAALVLRIDRDDQGRVWFVPVYGMPRFMRRNKVMERILGMLPEGVHPPQADEFLAELPIKGELENTAYHIMPLPDFGLLVLLKSGDPFDRTVVSSLARVNAKLATACVSCVKAEQAEAAAVELRRKVDELERSEDRYRAIFEGAVEGLFQAMWDGTVVRVNPSLAHMLGYESTREMLESGVLSGAYNVRPHDQEHIREVLQREGRLQGFETRVRRKDGSKRWVSLSARLVRDGSGEPLYIEGMVEDVEQRKQARLALQQAKAEAENLSRMKSNFLSMVSHELRTPLTSIYGFSRILLRQVGECETDCGDAVVCSHFGRMRENLNIISSESDRLTGLINNVLDLSRLEAGRFEWHDADVDVAAVLAHSVEVTEVLFREKKLGLQSDIPPSLPLVRADRDRLIQVCVNLLSNAVKFTREGEIFCSAACENGEVVVRVRDTGVGVPKAEREVIFDMFRQLGDTLTEKPRGSGLGLPICKEIVEHYGGSIGVHPAPEAGSVFWFSLPVLD